MSDQLELNFPRDGQPAGQGAIWIVSTDTAMPPSLPGDGAHLILDAFSGAPGPLTGDLVLLKSGRGDDYTVLAAVEGLGTAEIAGRLARPMEQVRPAAERRVSDLMLVSFRDGASPEPRPGLSSGLGRALTHLRSPSLRTSVPAVEMLCRHIDDRLPAERHPALSALIGRELADAHARCATKEAGRVRTEYIRAASLFRMAAMRGQERSTERALGTFDRQRQDQPELPFLERRTPVRGGTRLGYQARRALGTRIPLAGVPLERPAGKPPVWRGRGTVELPSSRLRDILAGVAGRSLDSAIEVRVLGETDAGRVWEVRAGFDTELAVLLGVAGATGPKDGFYDARVRCDNCTVSPLRLTSRIGNLSEFKVSGPSDASIVVELSTGVDRYVSIDVELPGGAS